jgi:hypothetical protein
MVELFFESPLTIGLVGSVATGIALVLWLQAGTRGALPIAVGLALLTLGLCALSVWVETDREKIQQVLGKAAQAVQQNDLPAVKRCLHPAAEAGIRQAEAELPQYHFTEARITGIKSIQVDRLTAPPSAVAEFNVAISVSARGVEVRGARRLVRVFLFQERGEWLIHNYEHFDIAQSFRERDLP